MKSLTLNSYQQRIEKVLHHMVTHLDDALTLETLAAVANFSPFHFHRIFRGVTGESVASLTRRLRLQHAGFLLREQQRTITEVAFATGYGSSAAFARSFKQAYGLSPTDFKQASTPITLTTTTFRVSYNPADTQICLAPVMIGALNMNITIEQFPVITVACIRHQGSYHNVGTAFGQLIDWAQQQQLWHETTQTIGLPYDDPKTTPVEQLRYDACITLDASNTPSLTDEQLRIEQIPAGRYAVYQHQGSYREIEDKFQQMFTEWLPASGEEPADRPCLERYLNDCNSLPENEWLTQLCIPLQN